MAKWLKQFDQTMLGMLFTDQHLSPSEVVRIARDEQCTDSMHCSKAKGNDPKNDRLPHTQLVGLR
jgi:hypothetical protein